ncbi:hypothetical protein EZS27_000669 [termite gut metagenome]|uniref:Uncharacterized protein n=1 Tax=termite gut metagenome TaxID=433724 RepID=A0A5J4T2V7_9ZZZZ
MTNGEFDNHYQSIVISPDIEYIALVSYIVGSGEILYINDEDLLSDTKIKTKKKGSRRASLYHTNT